MRALRCMPQRQWLALSLFALVVVLLVLARFGWQRSRAFSNFLLPAKTLPSEQLPPPVHSSYCAYVKSLEEHSIADRRLRQFLLAAAAADLNVTTVGAVNGAKHLQENGPRPLCLRKPGQQIVTIPVRTTREAWDVSLLMRAMSISFIIQHPS